MLLHPTDISDACVCVFDLRDQWNKGNPVRHTPNHLHSLTHTHVWRTVNYVMQLCNIHAYSSKTESESECVQRSAVILQGKRDHVTGVRGQGSALTNQHQHQPSSFGAEGVIFKPNI